MFDFEAFSRANGIPLLYDGHHHCHEGWVQTHCPFCSGGRSGYHLGFALETGNFNCWRCGGLRVFDVVGAFLRTAQKETILRALMRYTKRDSERIERKPISRRRAVPEPPGLGPLRSPHRKYLSRRGFVPSKLCRLWGLQGTMGISGIWNWRIVTALRSATGDIVAYAGRAISERTKPKSRMTPNKSCAASPAGFLYGIDKVVGRAVVIVEGITDVWRLGAGAVATLGIDWHKPQASILRTYERRYILYDPEPKAQRKAEELAAWLSLFPGTTEIITGIGGDPGSISDRKARNIMRRLGVAHGG